MADIELVIKIPEKTVNEIKDNAMFAKEIASSIKWDITSAIVNGTPLPKGHGDLIDRDKLLQHEVWGVFGEIGDDMPCVFTDYIETATIIIEADKTEGRNKE